MSDYAWCIFDKTHGWHPIVGDAPEVKELKALICELSLALVEPALEPDKLDKLLQKAKTAVD